MVAPTGNEINVEKNSPKIQAVTANKIDKIYIVFKLYVNWYAVAAGRDIKLYIKRPPTDFKFRLIVEHINIIIKVKINPSGIPQARDISLLKNKANIPLWNNNVKIIRIVVIIILSITSFKDEISKLPQKKLNISVKCSLNKAAKINAIAILKENNKLIETLLLVFAFFEMGFIIKAAQIQKTKPKNIGFIPINNPIIAPANAQCAMVTPTKGIFNNNIQTPIIPQDNPAKIDNISALLKKE